MKLVTRSRFKKGFTAIALVLAFSTGSLMAGGPKAKATKDISYTFQSSDGTNASAVAWHPVYKLYYAVIAGNMEYPLEAFDDQGNYKGGGGAGFDYRGMWYNSKSGTLQGNGSGEYGYCSVVLSNGIPAGEAEVFAAGQHQPDFQSVGTYNAAKKKIVFYLDGTLQFYNPKNGKQGATLDLKGLPSPATWSDINTTSVAYTGVAGYEYALLNFTSRAIYFFNASGSFSGQSFLPQNQAVNEMFWFSWANGRAWLYDSASRTWTAYLCF